jgi:hypothetical protein
MSFDYPQQPRRRKGGFGGIFMFLIIGAAIFFFMQSRGAPNPDGAGGERNGTRSVERKIDSRDSRIDRELREADEYRRQRADILGAPKSQDPNQTMPRGSGNNGDWSMEDVDTNNGKTAPSAGTAKKTIGEDGWSMEEVPSKKNSGTGFELNNSAGGEVKRAAKSDWSMQDVDPKTKKTTEGDWSVQEVGGKGGKK